MVERWGQAAVKIASDKTKESIGRLRRDRENGSFGAM